VKLAQVRRLALALPEAVEAPHFAFTSFRVQGKIFATAPPDGEHLHVFVSEQQREVALRLHPEFIDKLLWGGKVRGVRVLLPEASSRVVKDLLIQAWARKAPKNLLKAEGARDGKPGAADTVA
jgi:hypothetical protein